MNDLHQKVARPNVPKLMFVPPLKPTLAKTIPIYDTSKGKVIMNEAIRIEHLPKRAIEPS